MRRVILNESTARDPAIIALAEAGTVRVVGRLDDRPVELLIPDQADARAAIEAAGRSGDRARDEAAAMSGRNPGGQPGNVNATTHLAHCDSRLRPLATAQKRRLLRQIGLRANDLDGLGLAFLDNWARAQSKVEAMDRWAAEHGFLDSDGKPAGWTAYYVSCLNSARLALSKFGDYLRQRDEATVIDLSRFAPKRVGSGQ